MTTALAAMVSILAATAAAEPTGETPGMHLFILSGQSNMAGLDADAFFTPLVAETLGADRVIVVKDALSGQPIQRWYKAWKAPDGSSPRKTGDLYEALMAKVRAAADGKSVQTVTFVWMQGERDARESWGDVYADSLKGLVAQLRRDLGRDDVNVVIGRLSDFDLAGEKYPHWTKVRDAQVAVAKADARAAWIDTDDLNGEKNDLHYVKPAGYKLLGKRFAEKSLDLVRTLKATPGVLKIAPRIEPASSGLHQP